MCPCHVVHCVSVSRCSLCVCVTLFIVCPCHVAHCVSVSRCSLCVCVTLLIVCPCHVVHCVSVSRCSLCVCVTLLIVCPCHVVHCVSDQVSMGLTGGPSAWVLRQVDVECDPEWLLSGCVQRSPSLAACTVSHRGHKV